MPDLAVINLTSPSPFALRPLPGGRLPVNILFDTLRDIPGIGGFLILTVPGFDFPVPSFGESRPVKVCREERWNEQNLLSVLGGESAGFENILHVWGDAPLLDPALVDKLYLLHREGFAQYTFADGYPFGFTPEILKSTLVKELPRLLTPASVKKRLQRDLFFQIIQRDINSFDIETDIAPEDYRLYRLSFTADSLQNHGLVAGFLDAGALTREDILPMIKTRPDLLRTRPTYYQVQISDSCPQKCAYCSRPLDRDFRLSSDGSGGRFMPVDRFRKLCSGIADFSGEAVVSLSLTGEPSLHLQLAELVETALSFPGLKVLIETSGLGWNRHDIFSRDWDPERFFLIVSLDAQDPSLYKTLRGEGQEEALAFAGAALARWPGSVWLQGVRMNENEEDLEKFFRQWKEKTDNIIIQKYSTFAGLLPERKVTDLSPLDRFPCWALKREMAIGIDGDVWLCRNTAGRSPGRGNAFTDSLDAVWKKGEADWLAHNRGEYADPCAGCDDYYVFNF